MEKILNLQRDFLKRKNRRQKQRFFTSFFWNVVIFSWFNDLILKRETFKKNNVLGDFS